MSAANRQEGTTPLLEVRKLGVRFEGRRGGSGKHAVTAVEDVSFTIRRRQVFGLVGESGSGKTTLGRAILRLVEPTSGQVIVDGQDLSTLSKRALRHMRSRMQIIFQDSAAALSPRRTVEQTLREPLEHFGIGSPSGHQQQALEALATVGLDASAASRYPHQFSSGQRQRVMIARSLMSNPDLVIADEAVSALDVSVQAQILELITRLRTERGIAFLFISHDLAVIQQVADEVGVMYAGRLVERSSASAFFSKPRHPYSKLLLRAVPGLTRTRPVPDSGVPAGLQGEIDRSGCVFRARCPDVMDICRRRPPDCVTVSRDSRHHVECHLYRHSPGPGEEEPSET